MVAHRGSYQVLHVICALNMENKPVFLKNKAGQNKIPPPPGTNKPNQPTDQTQNNTNLGIWKREKPSTFLQALRSLHP